MVCTFENSAVVRTIDDALEKKNNSAQGEKEATVLRFGRTGVDFAAFRTRRRRDPFCSSGPPPAFCGWATPICRVA